MASAGAASSSLQLCPTATWAVARGEPLGRQDVALLAVRIVEQRDARGPVRVVLDCRHGRRHAELLAPEVDTPVLPLVAAPLMARGDVALVVTPDRAPQRLEE